MHGWCHLPFKGSCSVICCFRKGKGTMYIKSCKSKKSKKLLDFLNVAPQDNAAYKLLSFYIVNNKCCYVLEKQQYPILPKLFLTYFLINIVQQKYIINIVSSFSRIDEFLFLICTCFLIIFLSRAGLFQGKNCKKQLLPIINFQNKRRSLC